MILSWTPHCVCLSLPVCYSSLRKPGTGTAVTWQTWWWAAWSAWETRCLWVSASITKLSAVRKRQQSLQREWSAPRVSGRGRNKSFVLLRELLLSQRNSSYTLALTQILSDIWRTSSCDVAVLPKKKKRLRNINQSESSSCIQRPLTSSWTPLWLRRRFTSRIALCTCSTALQRRTACLSLLQRPTGRTDTGACCVSPLRSTTSAGLTSSQRLDGTRGSGTPVTGNVTFFEEIRSLIKRKKKKVTSICD